MLSNFENGFKKESLIRELSVSKLAFTDKEGNKIKKLSEKPSDLKLFEKYLGENLVPRGKREASKNTIRAYCKVYSSFHNCLNGREINQESINDFLKHHQRQFYKAGLGYLVKFRKIEGITFPRITEPTRKQETDLEYVELTRRAMKMYEQKAFDTGNYQLHLMMSVGNFTAFRIRELAELRRRNIHADISQLWKQTVKTRKMRKITAPPELIKELLDYCDKLGLKNDDRLFYASYGDNWDSKYKQIQRELAQLASDKIIGKAIGRTHNMRRGVINYLLEKNVPLTKIAAFTAQDPKTVALYELELTKKKSCEEVAKIIADEEVYGVLPRRRYFTSHKPVWCYISKPA